MTVTEVQGGNYLSKKSSCFFWSKASFLHEVIKELASTDVLKDQVEVLPVLVDVVQREDVLVLDQLHDGDLPLHLLQHGLAQLLLVDDLDGDFLPQHTVGAQLNKP